MNESINQKVAALISAGVEPALIWKWLRENPAA